MTEPEQSAQRLEIVIRAGTTVVYAGPAERHAAGGHVYLQAEIDFRGAVLLDTYRGGHQPVWVELPGPERQRAHVLEVRIRLPAGPHRVRVRLGRG